MQHQARKRFGQNFLHDESVINAIVGAVHPLPDEHLVEIGPGQGALTRPLLRGCRRLDVLEIDRDLVARLQRQFDGEAKLRIHSADALQFPLSELVENGERLRVIGNLPYNISTPLLFRLFEQNDCIEDMHFMLQKEVVERLCARPGDDAYGRLSVMTQYHCDAEALFEVYPESFHPQPKVTSSVFRLTPHRQPPVAVANLHDLEQVVAKAFSQRRKTLHNALKGLLDDDGIEQAGVDPRARAETLSLADYARLAQALQGKQG
ncbi:16S rRNA (adenine(1518)-N(6)/adenine(1519)-N(6))-dimethyltransferase RsmA [Methylogaea oryzae]|uniref:Ribosomal RNA small subunit methyltransferase A n=1 Tax=Methylogaea oryzae TaxID=1295382 RepID=A0A8D4VQJ1_9GAMM|nr:16S rRNA (adenine(1518)-N(6)/adenine(1519)-N(6))-dimethyltransferase RsmA [Methylogaea oryzae]BBL71872.1 ribosomal RNA small subunit methyltransferase A [Methylogaea oryzae]